MIIEAKAARDKSGQSDPRKRYEFNTPERLGKLPFYFALFVTGIALYLKSAFPANAVTNEGEDKGGDPAPGQRPPSDATAQVGPFQPDEIDETTTGSIDGGGAPNTISGSGIPWQTNFALPDQPPLAYATTFEPFSPQLAPFFPVAFSYAPSNDNGGPSLPGVDVPNVPTDQEPNHPGGDGDDDDDDEQDPGENPDDDDDDEQEEPDNDNEPVNRAPLLTGPVRLHDVFAGQVMLIGLSQLLFGATDPDGDVLSINDITITGGTLTQVGEGMWSFATLPGMLGVITFTYDVSDGLLEVVQTAVLEIVRKQHILTPGNDIYAASPWDDDIDGLAGHDIIDARDGNDVVEGRGGDDHINGGDGDDHLSGGRGNDIIFGGLGDDFISGGTGDDRLFGDEGDDIVEGNEGDDTLSGGEGDDVLDGGDGDDTIDGDEGEDTIKAGSGNDVADGGDGDDSIEGEEGNDQLAGGAGNDVIDGGEGCDTIDGEDGDDTLFGGAHDDTISGGEGDDHIEGGSGDDELEGNDGDDVIMAGSGDDVADGGEGDDTVKGEAGNDELAGGEGDDTLDGGDGCDIIEGEDGNDILIGGAHDDVLEGGDGDDILDPGSGDDTVEAGAGDDTIVGGEGDDDMDGGEGHDIIDYSDATSPLNIDTDAGTATGDDIGEDTFANIEEIIGGDGDDTFVVGAKATVLSGGRGDDLFIFTVLDNEHSLSQTIVHEILDFVVGDRIRVADYDISRQAERSEEERFEDFYDAIEDGDTPDLPIRVRHARYDDQDHTIIEADLDRNDVYEISIIVDGLHLPVIIDNNY